MSNLGSSYTKILALLHELENRDNYLSQIRTPKLSDKQLIALVFAAESLGLDSERHLFRQLPGALDGLIDRSVFNRRRRQLAAHIERFRQRLLNDLAPAEDTYFVDSMPLEVCKLGRAKRLRTCALRVFARKPRRPAPISAIARRTRPITSDTSCMPCAHPKE